MNSLRLRFLTGAIVLLCLFVLFTGYALQTALDHYSKQAEYNRLQGLVFSLLAAIDVDQIGQISVAIDEVPEPRLQQPDSGLTAVVYSSNGDPLWQSPSQLSDPATSAVPEPGGWIFTEGAGYTLSFGFEWELSNQVLHRFALNIVENASPLTSQRKAFAKQLWLWLLILSTLLLLLLLALLHWGLKPLRGVTLELEQVRGGKREKLEQKSPKEIQPLTDGINTLLTHERRQQQRYRHALDDLAHSLKTPLAIMQGQSHQPSPEVINEQVERMEQIIGHQLQRAATAGRQALRKPILIWPVVDRLLKAMQKVYAEKNLQFNNLVPKSATLPVDEADLMELLGNLLDNAAKYSQSSIKISFTNDAKHSHLIIEDDGTGIAEADRKTILKRGMRADNMHPGQGIGLAIAHDITRAYGGQLIIENAAPQGARIILVFSSAG